MTFIKHGDKRVNLENVTDYKPHGKKYISFRFSVTHDERQKHLSWQFANEDGRDKTLAEIDKIVEAKNIREKESNMSGHSEVSVEVIG